MSPAVRSFGGRPGRSSGPNTSRSSARSGRISAARSLQKAREGAKRAEAQVCSLLLELECWWSTCADHLAADRTDTSESVWLPTFEIVRISRPKYFSFIAYRHFEAPRQND